MSLDVIVLLNLGGGETIRVHTLPLPGDTVMTKERFHSIDAGKGPNSSIAMGRLGAKVAFIGICGRDPGGDRGENWMKEAGVDTSGLIRSDTVATGQGVRIVADDGRNLICSGLSASRALTEAMALEQLERLAPAKFFYTGFEIRPALGLAAARRAKELGMQTALNYSPVPAEPPERLDYIDYLVLNETEAAAVLGLGDWRELPRRELVERIRARFGCGAVILTLGPEGGAGVRGDRYWEIPGEKVETVDTSGAGDAVLSSMLVRLSSGMDVEAAHRWANRYAAYTTTIRGTIPAYPTRDGIEAVFRERGWSGKE